MISFAYVQLGWLQDAVNTIYDRLLNPAFDRLSNLLSDIMNGLFESLLLPILELHLSVSLELMSALIQNILFELLFRLQRVLLWALDAVERVFRMFSGLDPVYVRNISSGVMEEKGSLLLAITGSPVVRTALLGMILASFALCILASIVATIRSVGEMGGNEERSRSVGKVMRTTANALFKLILIPLVSLAIVLLGDALLKSIETATGMERVSVSNIIFTMSTLDAVREDVPDGDSAYYNSSTRTQALAAKNAKSASEVADFGLKDKYRKPYYEGTADRTFLAEVLKTFDIRRVDYFVGIGMTVLFLYLYGILAVNMIARIFDCVLLLLTEPFFAASMPLDEGKKFEQWQETFLGRLISGYGIIVGMNLYFGVVAMVFEGRIAFFGEGTTPAVDYITRIFFAAAGAYAILKAAPLVTGIMSSNAATREKEINGMGASFSTGMMGAAVSPVTYGAGLLWNDKNKAMLQEGIRSGFQQLFAKGGQASPASGAAGDPGALFDAKKDANGRPGIKTGGLIDGAEPFRGAKQHLTGAVPAAGGLEIPLAGALPGGGAAGGMDLPAAGDKGEPVLPIPGAEEAAEALAGGKAPEGGVLDPGFVLAGEEALNIINDGYAWAGERDEKERKEKKKMAELLGEELDEKALFAAEGSMGLDLNGDGFVSGSINDVEDPEEVKELFARPTDEDLFAVDLSGEDKKKDR